MPKEGEHQPSPEFKRDKRLFDQIRAGHQAREALENLGHGAFDPYLQGLIDAGETAEDTVASMHKGLVIDIVKKYVRASHLPFPDLLQEGYKGLAKAMDVYDPERGIQFNTVATWWVRQAVSSATNSDAAETGMRIPSNHIANAQMVYRTIQKWNAEFHEKPTVREIAESTNLLENEIEKILMAKSIPDRFDALWPDGHTTHGELYFDPDIPTPEEEAGERVDKEMLVKTIQELLDPQEWEVVAYYHGFIDGNDHSFNELEKAGLGARETIRKIYRKALEKLREPLFELGFSLDV